MSMIVYLNGQWLPKDQATVSVEDRGFMYADGVYEVVRFYNQQPIAIGEHMQRMNASMREIRIAYPAGEMPLDQVSRELLKRNNLADASVYWQVTRGAAPRKHKFPNPPVRPTVLAIAYPQHAYSADAPVTPLKAITRPETRWALCSIKAISLLANVLDTQAAVDDGCDEAILIRSDGIVTEASARGVIITEGRHLLTHPLDGRILDSITRRIVLDLARDAGYTVSEEYFHADRMRRADEIIAVGTTSEVASVIELDHVPVRSGKPGPIAIDLFDRFKKFVAQTCGIKK